MDVEGAFLEAELPEPIYMRLSADVDNVLRKLQPVVPRHGSSIIVKLKKALYGLVTASKLWYDRLKGALVSNQMIMIPVYLVEFYWIRQYT